MLANKIVFELCKQGHTEYYKTKSSFDMEVDLNVSLWVDKFLVDMVWTLEGTRLFEKFPSIARVFKDCITECDILTEPEVIH